MRVPRRIADEFWGTQVRAFGWDIPGRLEDAPEAGKLFGDGL